MTASDLKQAIENAGHEPHFFDRETMRFFGDRMSNYGVRSATVKTEFDDNDTYVGDNGVEVECWELWRRRAVKNGLKSSAYFSKKTLRRIFPVR